MHHPADQQRFLIVLGGWVDRVVEDPAVTVLDRIDRVVLAETSYRAASRLRRSSDVLIHCYEREGDARRVFGLFRD